MASAKIVEEQQNEESIADSAQSQLVDWVMGNFNPWKDDRDSKYKVRWDEYYRLWRGIWAVEDKQRKSERSRLITPALQQAIESVVAEIESAILDKPSFFDIADNPEDPEQRDVAAIRSQLRKDLDWADYEQALNEIFLIGGLFGTGLAKIDVRDVEIPVIEQGLQGATVTTSTRTQCKLVPILPTEFVIDPAAKCIQEAMGVAHEYETPRHEVVKLQNDGTYLDNDIKQASEVKDPILSDEHPDQLTKTVNIIDYQGLVPRALLDAVQPLELSEGETLVDLFEDETTNDAVATSEIDEDDLVEAVVTIANNGTLLKAKPNATLMGDRLFVSYRHEIVPDQFWGRGVAEKGYNSQKALDASMRARIDGLALTVHPMMGIDGGKMPRGFKFTVSPGKTVITNGDPSAVLKPMNFGNIDPNVFTNNAELERYVTMSTGGADASAPVTVNGRNETAAGMSMSMGNMVKRSKRTIRNIEREMIIPMIQKTHRVYMQLEPELYAAQDVTFRVTSVLGTMARELEQQQFAGMMNTVEPGSTGYWVLMKSIYQSSSLSNREEMMPIIDQKLQESLQPPQPDPMVELKKQEVTAKIRAEMSRVQTDHIRAMAEIARAANDARTAESEEAKNESQAILNLAKAQAESMNTNFASLKAQLEVLESESVSEQGLAEKVIGNVNATGNTNTGA